MRNKIDYGIDLGTTNSSIARMENGTPTIKKSDTLKDTVPSCVHFNKKRNILVGDPAFNVMKNDNTRALKTFEPSKTNTYTEFKRTMGTTHKYESSNMEKDYTSEELSAEVLKKLKSFIKDENISSIVITVPAKFLNPQKEATIQAARLAGFKHIELLQEPVAAATAYGLTAKDKDSYWLVFDFGGGTFDAAIIKSEEGILTVKDTEGDNWLGGKNIDEAIVDQIIIPYLRKNYAIESILQDTEKLEILRNAVKFFAEEAKIQLSFVDIYNILSNLGDLPFKDENGQEPEIDITLTQKDMERILNPIFQKAIDITKELLQRNNLTGKSLSALILVGGPTFSPILRQMLKEQITNKLNTSVDPMTVVAKGAALFASTVSVSEEVIEASRDKTKLQLDIAYEATSVETKEWINIKVLAEKTTGVIPPVLYADVVRGDRAWSSGKTKIGKKAALVEVLLQEGRSNSFTVNVYDEEGNKLECQPDQFSILQGVGDLDRMSVLPYNIGIGKWFDTEEKDLFQPVKGLEKNKKLPATGVIKGLKTRSAIRPGIAKDIILIPIYQGDYNAEGTNPVLNNWITDVIISGENLPELLPEGSEVDITIQVDRSEQMQFSAFFPLIDHTRKLKIQIKQIKPPTEEQLADEIATAKQTAQRLNETNILAKLNGLEQQFKNERGSADGRMKILDSLRKELLKLDSAKKEAVWPALEQDLKQVLSEMENLIVQIKKNKDSDNFNMKRIETEYQEYKKNAELIIEGKKQKGAKELISEIENSRSIILIYLIPERFLQSFNTQFNIINWNDPDKAKELIKQGFSNARSNYNREKIAEIIFSIYKEMKNPGEFKTVTLR